MAASNDFENATASFISFLSNMGVTVNPKMKIVDLRSEGRGRGAGKLSFFKFCTISCNQLSVAIYYPVDPLVVRFLYYYIVSQLTFPSRNRRFRGGRDCLQYPATRRP